MLYSVVEVSKSIGLSKQSIYKKLKTKELQEYITKNQGITYINEEGFKLIKHSLKLNEDGLRDFKSEKDNNTLNKEIATDIDILSMNKEVLNIFKCQLEEKDLQIKDKDLQIHELHKLVENSQILLKEKPQDKKLLEQHFQELDDKIMNIKNRNVPKQKGFFKKIFKK